MKIDRLNLPISFSTTAFDDERFLKVRVKVMHTGLNLNSSTFSLEAIEKAKPTLANVPLLAFVKKVDGEDRSDFAGHEWEIRISNSEMKYVYLGRPIGMIPETNNYSINTDEAGRTFVEVDGYIWKDYANEALDIFERDGAKKVSMEINVSDYSWADDYSYVDILDYKYTGIAVLGDDVSEAMIGAKAEVVKFSENSISTLMSEVKQMFERHKEEPAIEQPAAEDFTSSEDDNTDDTIPNEEEEKDDTEANEDANTDADGADESGAPADENSVQEPSEGDAGAEDFQEEEKNPEDGENFSKIEEPLATDSVKDIDVSAFEAEIETLRQTNTALEQTNQSLQEELNTLREYRAQKEKEEKQSKIDELFEQFSAFEKLEEFSALKAIAMDETLEMLELKLYALKGKYGSDPGLVQINFSKQDNEPEWIKLVKQNLNK